MLEARDVLRFFVFFLHPKEVSSNFGQSLNSNRKRKIMRTKYLLFAILALPINGLCQKHIQEPPRSVNTGMFSLGVRNTISLFNSHGAPSFGVGGHFRIQLSERVNTEWYADFMKSKLENQLSRMDAHIGWSVLYYVLAPERSSFFQPFIEAGHCFDFTNLSNSITGKSKKRLNSAMQLGIGVHCNLNDRLDLTFKTQYMLHLGGHIHAEKNSTGIYEIYEHPGFQAEGHWLNTISITYKIGKLWAN